MNYIIIYILGFLAGFFAFPILMVWLRNLGTIAIDMRDSRKDLVRIDLNRDLDEVMHWRYAIVSIDGKWESDFYEGGKK